MKRARPWAMAFGLSVALGGPTIAAVASLDDFAAKAPIELQGNGPYFQLTLPIEAHFTAHFPDMRDLRVFNGQGEMVPFSVIRERPRNEQASEPIAVPWFPLYTTNGAPDAVPEVRVDRRASGTVVSVTGGGSTSDGGQKRRGYLLDLSGSKDAAHRLTLDWDPAMTGFQQVTVEASDDLQNWQIWRRTAQLARLEFNGQHIERRDIDLPDRHADYVRLTWREPLLAPVLTSVTLSTASSTNRPTPFVWSATLEPTRASEGNYEWEFPQLITPERVKIGLAQVNVLAPAELWGKRDGESQAAWQLLARTVIYRLEFDGREWENEDLTLSGQPVGLIKLKPDTRSGGLGSGPPTLSLGLAARQVLFLARGSGPFVLALGSADAKAADLAPTILIPGYDSSAAPPISTATMGTFAGVVGQPALANAPPQVFALTINWKTLTLWSILLTGVASIAVMAFYLLRQMRK